MVPPISPLLAHAGREFSGRAGDLDELSTPGAEQVEGDLSVSFVARWDSLENWASVLCWGSGPRGAEPSDSVRIFSRAGTRTLTFEVSHGPRWNYRRVDARDAVLLGVSRRYLCVASAAGCLRIYGDGILLAEERAGWAPHAARRERLSVGGYAGRADSLFRGHVADLRVWAGLADPAWAFEELGPAEAPGAAPEEALALVVVGRAPRGEELAKRLRKAASCGDVRAAQRLLDQGAALQAADGGGKTALHYAARAGATGTVRLLLEARADANAASDSGERPLDEAEWWAVRRPQCATDVDALPRLEREAEAEGLRAPRLPPPLAALEDGEVASEGSGSATPPPAGVQWAATEVVLNCANLGHTFAEKVRSAERGFDWTGVHNALQYYCSRGLWVHAPCKAGTLARHPVPAAYDYLSRLLVVAPAMDVIGKDVDDLFTLRIAQEYSCPFVDNDNYRDWKKLGRAGAGRLWEWLWDNEAELRVGYIFRKTDGAFVPHRAL